MHFIQSEFVVFMALVYALYWIVRERTAQNIVLVVASAVFYGYVHPWFLGLLWLSATVDYAAARGIGLWPAHKKGFLALSLGCNLGLLGLFKYYDFFAEQVAIALGAAGLNLNFATLNLLLPVGISFYTFQTLSYTIDVYRGRLVPRTNYLDVLVYVSFFPQLVAGPIERAEHLLPQVEQSRRFSWEATVSGFGLAMWGAFKKVCIADALAPYVDEVFMTREPSFAMVFAACWGFGVQMLADFSAYTDLARGTARMLGFELMENFKRPYGAASTPEFWRRWHISLSSWVGDYVYQPLLRRGRPGFVRTCWALFVTFFLIGMWHGASYNFIVLGMWSAMWMAVYTFATPLVPRSVRSNPLAVRFGSLLHIVLVLQPCALLFRELDLTRVVQHVSQPVFGGTREEWIAAYIVATMAFVGSLPLTLSYWLEDHVLPRVQPSAWFLPMQTTVWSFQAVAIFVFYRDASQDFIYFQF